MVFRIFHFIVFLSLFNLLSSDQVRVSLIILALVNKMNTYIMDLECEMRDRIYASDLSEELKEIILSMYARNVKTLKDELITKLLTIHDNITFMMEYTAAERVAYGDNGGEREVIDLSQEEAETEPCAFTESDDEVIKNT